MADAGLTTRDSGPRTREPPGPEPQRGREHDARRRTGCRRRRRRRRSRQGGRRRPSPRAHSTSNSRAGDRPDQVPRARRAASCGPSYHLRPRSRLPVAGGAGGQRAAAQQPGGDEHAGRRRARGTPPRPRRRPARRPGAPRRSRSRRGRRGAGQLGRARGVVPTSGSSAARCRDGAVAAAVDRGRRRGQPGRVDAGACVPAPRGDRQRHRERSSARGAVGGGGAAVGPRSLPGAATPGSRRASAAGRGSGSRAAATMPRSAPRQPVEVVLAAADPVHDRHRRAAAERRPAGAGVRDRRGPGVHVGGGGRVVAVQDLRGEVAGRAEQPAGVGEPRVVGDPGQPEVDEDRACGPPSARWTA